MSHPDPKEIASNSVEGVELLIIEDDETENLQKEGNSEELGQYCEEENVLESDFDLNNKDDENYDNEEYEEFEYLIEDSSSHDVNKDTSEEETLDNYNLRYNSLKLLKYSNICLFKCTNNYFVCFECREWFKDMNLLRNHVESTHTYDQIRRAMVIEKDAYQNAEITDLECKTCSVVLNSLKQLKDHLVEHNIRLKQGGSSLIPYKICTEKLTCQLCEEKFGSVNLIRKHMYGHLNYTDLSNSRLRKTYSEKDNRHPISGTTLKSFKHRSKLRGPKIRPEETPFKCKQCPQKFKYDYQRFQHIIAEHKTESKLFQCKFCPKIFLTVHWLTKHTNCAHQRELDSE